MTSIPFARTPLLDPASFIQSALGGTVVADYDAALNVRPLSGVVGVHDDRRCSTPDGQVFVPGVAGEGILTGDVTQFDGATAITAMAEFSAQPGATAEQTLICRRSGSTAATWQFQYRLRSGADRIELVAGDGAATISDMTSTAGSIVPGVRYRAFVRYDGSQATDATKVTFWIATWNPLTQAWSNVVQSATQTVTAGVPAALITLASTTVGIGRLSSFSTGVPFFGALGGNGTSIRVWDSALSEAQMNAEVASSTPVIAAGLAYNFSGATPYANLGSWANGDGTAGSATVICSGDRRYAGLASAGTNRPAYSTGAAFGPVITADGSNDYLRNITRGQLEGITSGETYLVLCTANVTDTNANRYLAALTNSVTTQGIIWNTRSTDSWRVIARNGANSADAATADVLRGAGIRAYAATRTANTDIQARVGLLAGVTDTEALLGATMTRLTVFASMLDTPSSFCASTYRRLLIVRGITDSAVIALAQQHFAQYAQRYYGAQVFA